MMKTFHKKIGHSLTEAHTSQPETKKQTRAEKKESEPVRVHWFTLSGKESLPDTRESFKIMGQKESSVCPASDATFFGNLHTGIKKCCCCRNTVFFLLLCNQINLHVIVKWYQNFTGKP